MSTASGAAVPRGEPLGRSGRVRVGEVISELAVTSIQGQRVVIPSGDVRGPTRFVHLQFRRFAGCPICNLHVREVARRVGELTLGGVREIAVFHSTAEAMLPFQADLPYPVIADPDKALYRRFGVESGLRSVADPRAWLGFARGVVARHPSSSTTGEGGHLGLPADFLLDATGRVAALKYGTHADDQWSVDDILAAAGVAGA